MNNKRESKIKKLNRASVESFKITALYFLTAYGYLFLSDWIVMILVDDPILLNLIQSIKGLISLGLIGIVYYFIILNRLQQFIGVNHQMNQVLEQLKQKNQVLIELEEKHFKLAYYDTLTGLMNKQRLELKVNRMIEQKEPFAFVYMDIDNFGAINELKGHVWGDHALILIAKELEKLSKGNVVSRLSEDSFVLLLSGMTDHDACKVYVEEVLSSIKELINLQAEVYFYTASAGISIFPEHGHTYTDILRYANLALSQAKKNGKDQIVFYNQYTHELKLREYDITNSIKTSLQQNDFYIVYQPIIDFKKNHIRKVEALIRWLHPKLGMIPPNDFIYLSEISGSILELTHFVYESVFKQMALWNQQGLKIQVDINVSPKVLMHQDFIKNLNYYIHKHQVDKGQVIIEVTESLILSSIDQAIMVLNQLRSEGYRIALDDFGSGYSSLTYLKHLPIDILKMDKAFIATIDKNELEKQFLKFVLDLAHAMHKEVVLEGVETISQETVLKPFNVDYVQGFLYYKPMKVEELTQILQEKYK
ncbi:Cyclic di-GMP phosphodiesterase Gmr [Acholeplasma oculi]|uniref:Diguanylate cyclase/phosphodiesterase n=1 Tax=Acholeplasma oculi TaxID=35623 RepID=A0A061AHG9_9MOLU|nr:bifunctional diguanylate cyclase/phosphodiesterase [Acholeplasma oculi]CDR30427.1 Diguanylate cyclase/phosphodiesterase [Acholeplasma oculi]SKC50534.1 diguanylate cyclase (GGDEF) domain-containing protein [Acholeplasma oculi]SUT88996.1 Cyclic di-GMP phosphodiesterase Gmr [Acholeplasma oculi]